MEATIAQAELAKAFKVLKLTLPSFNKAIIPACSGVHLKADAQNNKVIATTFDSNSFTQVELPAQNVVDGERLINGQKLIEFVNRAPAGDIQFVEQSSQTTQITYGGGRPVKMVGMDPSTYPTLPSFNPTNSFDITTDELKLLVKRTAWAHKKGELDGNEIILSGIGIAVRDDGNGGHTLSFSATDRINAAYKAIPVAVQNEFDLVIKADQLQEVANIMPPGEVCTISWDSSFVMFKASNITYFGRQLADRYPNLKSNMDRFLAVKASSFECRRQDLLTVLGLVEVIVSGDELSDNQAEFAFSANGLEIFGQKDSVGTIRETVSGTLTGTDITFDWKVPIVIQALKAMDCDDVVFELPNTPNMPSIVHPKGDDNELYLVLPIAKR